MQGGDLSERAGEDWYLALPNSSEVTTRRAVARVLPLGAFVDGSLDGGAKQGWKRKAGSMAIYEDRRRCGGRLRAAAPRFSIHLTPACFNACVQHVALTPRHMILIRGSVLYIRKRRV